MTTITFPQQFQGFFQRTQVQYRSLIAESRETLHNTAIPKLLSPYYHYMVKENPQPSFMLLPLMFLGVAEASGGIQPQHRTYLPYIMLMMELCAVMDDTADRTPMRSNRETFVEKFGEESATPFAATLVALAARETARTEPELIGLLYTLVADLGSYELWEMEHRYPALSEFPEWLENRYIQAKTATAYALNSALQLNGLPHFSDELLIPMSRVLQDVDDIVNIIEARESVGENRDLDLGIVTYPLIAACEAVPGLEETITRFWQPYHAIAKLPRAQFLAELPGVIAAQQHESDYIYHCLNTYGIPAAIQHIEEDCAICIENTPEGPLRDIIEEFVLTFAARIPQIRSRSV